jgi:hypothetical protein
MKIVKAIIALIVGMIAFGNLSFAQQSVNTLPSGRSAINGSSTIAVTNTFQALFLASTSRKNCLIQNNGAGTMYVYFGTISDATLTNSIKLTAGSALYCANSGIVATDAVSITGTATQAFYASQQ